MDWKHKPGHTQALETIKTLLWSNGSIWPSTFDVIHMRTPSVQHLNLMLGCNLPWRPDLRHQTDTFQASGSGLGFQIHYCYQEDNWSLFSFIFISALINEDWSLNQACTHQSQLLNCFTGKTLLWNSNLCKSQTAGSSNKWNLDLKHYSKTYFLTFIQHNTKWMFKMTNYKVI